MPQQPAPTTTQAAAPGPTSQPQQPTPSLTPKATPTRPAQATPAAEAQFQGPLSVIIQGISDEMLVQSSQLELNGTADPETAISFDDQIVYVGPNRTFSVTIVLEEGPNLIEITASDLSENSATVYLSVTYEPQP